MLARFFIERPIFAWVLSIVILLAGGVSVVTLPVAQYPDITPPTVQVTASYPGASAQVVCDAVAAPIEEQVNGVEGLLYMSSQCTNDGAYNLTLTFELGTDLDMATVLVQNRVSWAMAQLPMSVQLQGINTKKKSPSILLAINLISPGGTYDDIYLSNYATIQVKDEIFRLDGVGDITYLGERDYSMRAWLDPQKLTSRNISVNEVISAVQNQNMQVAAGTIGRQPVPEGQQFQLTLTTLGRLQDPDQFGDIIIKTSQGNDQTGRPSTQVVRLRDVARVELGAQQYDQICKLDGMPSVALAIFQQPGSNAMKVAKEIRDKMEELKKSFPADLDYRIVYDTTPFIQESVNEVFKTLRDAVILVAIVVLFFLQDWKAMILPMIDVPVSLVGAFAVLAVMGFSLNNLTLFGLVLAIGIVVDDAIVVLENVERQMATGLDAKTATIKAMDEITGPIVAITLVLSSVFLPSVFMPSITGQFYRQFALTISAAMVISAMNAMTLTPSRAASVFSTEHVDEHGEPIREALPWWIFCLFGGLLTYWIGANFLGGVFGHDAPPADGHGEGGPGWGMSIAYFAVGFVLGGFIGKMIILPVNRVLAKFFGAFNRLFDRITDGYSNIVKRSIRVSFMVLAIYGGLLYLTAHELVVAPKGFIPTQDQGYLLVNVQLPDSASVQRTEAVMDKLAQLALGDPNDPNKPGIPGVQHMMSVAGQSVLLSANASNFGSCFCILKPFEERHSHDEYDAVVAEKLRAIVAQEIPEAQINIFRAPPIQGLGTSAGFKMQIEQRGYIDLHQLQSDADEMVAEAAKNPDLLGVSTMFRAETPQIYLDIDRTKCESLGVAMNDAFTALQVYMGGYYVNLFNEFGRTWQVNLLAEPSFRTQVEDLNQIYVRNRLGDMVPLATLMQEEDVGGPVMVNRYNMYASASIQGLPAQGTSSGTAMQMMEELAENLGLSFQWTEIAFMQQEPVTVGTFEISAGLVGIFVFALGAILVFLVLAAKYESWKLPFSVILVVPMCLLCSVTGMLIAAMPVDIFVQIGFIVLVGLAAKNAILIVEFAHQLHLEGKPLDEATVEACRLRLRPIIMTSFAFILGVVPLVLGTGAGAEMRNSLGTAVFSGMIGVTFFGIFLTPVFFYVMERFGRKKKAD
ncbi:efflux RND transporter permease subunit [Lacipirellula sp.]|uniref:efflux RND transporter permease subunit n=1 Tax=Lacipirellula sp. TaxID=2691419 RepID=UPI003D0E0D9C